MSIFTAVDLSRMPFPDIIETLDFEVIFEEVMAELIARLPDFSVPADTDPLHKVLQVYAYREMLIRQQFNDRARGCFLAYAEAADLDNLGALFNVVRLQLAPGDPVNNIPPTMESDIELRRRIQLAPEGFSVAGPEGAYIFHALSASPEVLDASAISPAPGEVMVTVLARLGAGTPSQELLDTVEHALTSESVRPLTDKVTVQAAAIVDYRIEAVLYTYVGPDSALVLAESKRRLQQYVEESRRLGRDIPRSALYSMLHVEGIQRVELQDPLEDLVLDRIQAGYCTEISVIHGGNDE